jgi:hypothetical protein
MSPKDLPLPHHLKIEVALKQVIVGLEPEFFGNFNMQQSGENYDKHSKNGYPTLRIVCSYFL